MISVKLSSATAFYKVVKLCHLEVGREDREVWGKSKVIPVKHPISAQPALPEQDMQQEGVIQVSTLEASMVHTAAARAL